MVYWRYVCVYSERSPAGRLGHPEELANLAAYLVSDYASWLTGTRARVCVCTTPCCCNHKNCFVQTRRPGAAARVSLQLSQKSNIGAVGYRSFHPMAQCVVHALEGLACRARVTLQAVLSAHVAFAPRARLHQSFSRTLRSQKTKYCFQWVQNLGTPTVE